MPVVITNLLTGRCDRMGNENVKRLTLLLDDLQTEVACLPALPGRVRHRELTACG